MRQMSDVSEDNMVLTSEIDQFYKYGVCKFLTKLSKSHLLFSVNQNNMTLLKVGSHDPFFLDPIIFLALFQLTEMLFRLTNFFEFE